MIWFDIIDSVMSVDVWYIFIRKEKFCLMLFFLLGKLFCLWYFRFIGELNSVLFKGFGIINILMK